MILKGFLWILYRLRKFIWTRLIRPSTLPFLPWSCRQLYFTIKLVQVLFFTLRRLLTDKETHLGLRYRRYVVAAENGLALILLAWAFDDVTSGYSWTALQGLTVLFFGLHPDHRLMLGEFLHTYLHWPLRSEAVAVAFVAILADFYMLPLFCDVFLDIDYGVWAEETAISFGLPADAVHLFFIYLIIILLGIIVYIYIRKY